MTDPFWTKRVSAFLCIILSSCAADSTANTLAKCWSGKPVRESARTYEVSLEAIAFVDRMHGGQILAIRSSSCPDHRLVVQSYGSVGQSQLEPIWTEAEASKAFGVGIRGRARIQALTDVDEGGLNVRLLEFTTLERLSRARTDAIARTF